MHCCGFGILPNAKKNEKEMNALLILKTTKAATCGRLSLDTELAFKTNKRKACSKLINANNELIFQVKEKVKRAAELIAAKEKAELYLDMASSAFVSLDEKVMSL
jgi:hypothetical protein